MRAGYGSWPENTGFCTNAIVRPSGDHDGATCWSDPPVSFVTWEPSAAMTKMSYAPFERPCPVRNWFSGLIPANAMLWPSGDHEGWNAHHEKFVSLVSPVPSVFTA